MAAELIFRGVRYQRGARIEPAGSDRLVFAITAEGNPKPWLAQEPEAWWRNVVDGNVGDRDEVLGFIKQYGFIFAPIDTTPRLEMTERWHDLQAALGLAASAWNVLDPNGTSEVDETKRAAAGESLRSNAFIKDRVQELTLVFDPAGEPGRLVRQAGSLAAYMVASALHGLENRLPMRVCAYCARWFYPRRSDQKFCSDAHRSSFNFKAKMAAHEGADTFSGFQAKP
jgi:hypothetical protein